MKIFIADTNIFLRYFLKDNASQAQQSADYLRQAKNRSMKIIVLPQIIFEAEFAMRKVYRVPRKLITKELLSVVKNPYLHVENKDMLVKVLHIYKQTNLHIVDSFLIFEASLRGVNLLTFDKQLKKLSTTVSA